MTLQAAADFSAAGIHARLVVAAAIDVHEAAQERDHRLSLCGEPFADGAFVGGRAPHRRASTKLSCIRCSCIVWTRSGGNEPSPATRMSPRTVVVRKRF